MEIIFEKPAIEPTFQAEIYRSGQMDGTEVYRVVVGRYGTEIPSAVGEYIDTYRMSDFMNRPRIERWIEVQVAELEKAGKTVEFDGNWGYVMAKAYEQLASPRNSSISLPDNATIKAQLETGRKLRSKIGPTGLYFTKLDHSKEEN